jgi:hypothetical protein
MSEKPFYRRPPAFLATWFDFAHAVMEGTTSQPDAYVTGWLDASQSYERLCSVVLMFSFLRRCCEPEPAWCEKCERERLRWQAMLYGPTTVRFPGGGSGSEGT